MSVLLYYGIWTISHYFAVGNVKLLLPLAEMFHITKLQEECEAVLGFKSLSIDQDQVSHVPLDSLGPFYQHGKIFSMDTCLHPLWIARWNYVYIFKLQWWMDKQFHPTFYWACDYLSVLGSNLIHVSERGLRRKLKGITCLDVRTRLALQWRHNEHISSQITGVSIVCSTVCLGTDRRIHQGSASLAFVMGNPSVDFPSHRVSNAENASIWWRHHW